MPATVPPQSRDFLHVLTEALIGTGLESRSLKAINFGGMSYDQVRKGLPRESAPCFFAVAGMILAKLADNDPTRTQARADFRAFIQADLEARGVASPKPFGDLPSLVKTLRAIYGQRSPHKPPPEKDSERHEATAPHGDGESLLDREHAVTVMHEIIAEATARQEEFCVAGVAATQLLGGESTAPLRGALKAGASARFILLDPNSHAARRRAVYEWGDLPTDRQIRAGCHFAAELCAAYPGKFRFTLAQDIPLFICSNRKTAMAHSYLARGRSESLYWKYGPEGTRKLQVFIERLWGERWIMFGLGNILVPFNSGRMADALLAHMPKGHKAPDRETVRRFIFGPRSPAPTGHTGLKFESELCPNDLIDTGKKDIDWLHRELRRKFKMNGMSAERFRGAWCSSFSSADRAALDCVTRAQAAGFSVAICSNTNKIHWDFICEQQPGVKNLPHWLSFEIGVLKNQGEFYEEIVHRDRRPHEEHLLIDDARANVHAAAAKQFRTLHSSSLITWASVHKWLEDNFWLGRTIVVE
jgi:hypothetical protein